VGESAEKEAAVKNHPENTGAPHMGAPDFLCFSGVPGASVHGLYTKNKKIQKKKV
jgi:hypothetical protein